MAIAPKWRQSDKARRQAIHAFVKSHRDELLKATPHRALRNKDTKRNELVRVGRARFAQLPEEEQARFLEKAEVPADEPQASNFTSADEPMAEVPVGAADCGVLASRSPDRGARAVGKMQPVAVGNAQPEAPVAASSGAAVSFPALRGAGGDSWVMHIIISEFTFLQNKFLGPRVFDVLAAAFRLMEQFDKHWKGETDRVKAAICLGIGAKFAAVGPSYTLDIWRHFTNPKMVPYMRCVELRLVAVWARHGFRKQRRCLGVTGPADIRTRVSRGAGAKTQCLV